MNATSIPDIILKDITDQPTRENFFRIQKFLQKYPLFRGEWKFFELEFASAVTSKTVPHGLGFKPTDVIQTSLIGTGTLAFDFASFTDKNLVVTTTGACTVRAFVGAYREEL